MPHIETQSEWEARMAGKILDFVRNEICVDLRFLQPAFSVLERKPDTELNAFATDGNRLYFAPEWMISVFRKNPAYLDRAYLHTILHCIFSHPWIGGNFERTLYGLASDIAVEYTIDRLDKPCTRRALSYMRQQFYEKMRREKQAVSAAVIYRILIEETDAEYIRALQMEFYTDDHRYWPKEEKLSAAAGAAQKKWNKVARQMTLEQKRRGEEKEEGEQLLAAQVQAGKSRRSYRDFLQKFSVLREEITCDPDEFDLNYYTYGLHIYKNMPLIEPLESREVKKIQEFAVVLDTSYSTSGELIRNFLKETFAVLSEQDSFFTQCRMHIIQCDEKVHSDVKITGAEELQEYMNSLELYGDGGTDFRPAFAYVEELMEKREFENLKGLVYFTDGYGLFPAKMPPYRTAFVFMEQEPEDVDIPAWAMKLVITEEEL